MKTFIITTYLILLSFNFFSQNTKTCESPDEEALEVLNTISINKCDISEQEHTSTRKVVTNISHKKKNNRIAHYVRKNNKPSNSNQKNRKLISKEVLFSVVDNVPLIKGCRDTKNKTCFNKKFYDHFSKNFNPENIYADSFKSRIFVQFVITTKGKISNIQVKGAKNKMDLINEIKRVINKLPSFTSAVHKGLPVNVVHSLPINLRKE